MIPPRFMIRILAALALLLASMPAMAQVWKGEVPAAAKVAALQKAAAKGDPAAMADVAFLSSYCRGGVKYDPKLIFEYSRKSARAGNAFGMACLSFCYIRGFGVDADGAEACRWAEKSAVRKHPYGLLRLGNCHESRLGAPWNAERMLDLYREAADMGAVNARYALAYAHFAGYGMKQDRDEAFAISDGLVRDYDWFPAALLIAADIGKEQAGDASYERALDCVSRHAALGLPDAIRIQAQCQRQRGMMDDETFLSRFFIAVRMEENIACRNLSVYVDDYPPDGYDMPVYATESTVYDLRVLAATRGANCGTDMRYARRVISAFTNGGDAFPRNLAKARAIAQSCVLASGEMVFGIDNFHTEMAVIYQTGVRHKVKGFERADLAVAHAVHDCATNHNCMRWLLSCHGGNFPGFKRDIAKAYVTAKLAHEMKDYLASKNDVKRIEKQLKDADWKEVRRLQDDGYPTAPKFREEARKLILASGFKLPEEKPEPGPEEETLLQ